jgi:hypothetical protein
MDSSLSLSSMIMVVDNGTGTAIGLVVVEVGKGSICIPSGIAAIKQRWRLALPTISSFACSWKSSAERFHAFPLLFFVAQGKAVLVVLLVLVNSDRCSMIDVVAGSYCYCTCRHTKAGRNNDDDEKSRADHVVGTICRD